MSPPRSLRTTCSKVSASFGTSVGRHGIEGDAGRELGGIVAVDAVALEQAPMFRRRVRRRDEASARVANQAAIAATPSTAAPAAILMLGTPPTKPRVPPTPSEAVPIDSSAARSRVGPKVQAEPSKSQSQEKLGVPEPGVELFGRRGREHVFGLQARRRTAWPAGRRSSGTSARCSTRSARVNTPPLPGTMRVSLVGYLEQHVERVDQPADPPAGPPVEKRPGARGNRRTRRQHVFRREVDVDIAVGVGLQQVAVAQLPDRSPPRCPTRKTWRSGKPPAASV